MKTKPDFIFALVFASFAALRQIRTLTEQRSILPSTTWTAGRVPGFVASGTLVFVDFDGSTALCFRAGDLIQTAVSDPIVRQNANDNTTARFPAAPNPLKKLARSPRKDR